MENTNEPILIEYVPGMILNLKASDIPEVDCLDDEIRLLVVGNDEDESSGLCCEGCYFQNRCNNCEDIEHIVGQCDPVSRLDKRRIRFVRIPDVSFAEKQSNEDIEKKKREELEKDVRERLLNSIENLQKNENFINALVCSAFKNDYCKDKGGFISEVLKSMYKNI